MTIHDPDLQIIVVITTAIVISLVVIWINKRETPRSWFEGETKKK